MALDLKQRLGMMSCIWRHSTCSFVLSVLRFTDSNYPFDIFKPFLKTKKRREKYMASTVEKEIILIIP
jgi:hypothetical protein